MNTEHPPHNVTNKSLLIFSAWLSILLISELPDILCSTLVGRIPAWLLWVKVVFLILFAVLCRLRERLLPLKPFAVVMAIFYIALSVSELVKTLPWWQGLMGESDSIGLVYLRPMIRDIGVTLAVLAALWIVKRRRSEFFFVRGQLDATIEPVRWLGIGPGESWSRFGWIFASVAALGVAIPTFLSLRPSWDLLQRAIPSLPAVLLLAAINAFNEEIYFRATLLSTLPAAIGKNHALLISVVIFGLAHYLNGSPPGVVGFAMTGFLAWLMGKSMLETKGLCWPWFIHFVPDVVVFASYAVALAQQ